MKRLNEQRIDIDKSGDDLIITMNIFNSDQYDLMNRRIKKTDSIIELEIFNNSQISIEINNPELVVFDVSSHNAKVTRYNSSDLENTFPLLLPPSKKHRIAYSSKSTLDLLKQFLGEMIKFQIKGSDSEYFESLHFGGDDLTGFIERRDQFSSWKHKNVYDFNKVL